MAFRAADRTLRDEEVNASFRKVIESLKSKLGVDVRE
jgi:phenylalanyl-tRNA synthetase beta subunit